MLSYTHAHEKKIIKLLAINEEFFLGLLSYIHANEKIIIKLLVDNEFYVIYLPPLLLTLYATNQFYNQFVEIVVFGPVSTYPP